MSRGFLKINVTNHVTKERKNKILRISLINFQWLRKRIKMHPYIGDRFFKRRCPNDLVNADITFQLFVF